MQNYPQLKTNILGFDFKHPLGIAAGFDKNAKVIDPLFKQNCAFVEVGTVTPKGQKGNKKPRMFRLYRDKAVINRSAVHRDRNDG